MKDNSNIWNYAPPHRGAVLDGGTPGDLENDNSVDGGWADRTGQGSSTSGHVYVEEAPFDTGKKFARQDGEWVSIFPEGSNGFDSISDLVLVIEQLDKRLTDLEETVDQLSLSEDGWDDARVSAIEAEIEQIKAGNVTFDKLFSKGNITAYTDGN